MIDVPILVKDALRDGRRLKNIRILVLNDDGTTDFVIDNDTLVSESVHFDERMCSGDTIKFGLCEGSFLEFQYFDHPNLYGRRINVFIDVQYMGDNGLAYYPIPMGFYQVKKCARQASTGIMKVSAYNKLQSEYLDQKANAEIIELFGDSSAYVMDINRALLGEYGVDVKEYTDLWPGSEHFSESDATATFSPFRYTTLIGDQGPFSPAILKENADYSTSSNIYMSAEALMIWYESTSQVGRPYVQIKIDPLVTEADNAIADWIKEQFGKISGNASADTLWSRLQNMSGNITDDEDALLKGYFFNIIIGHSNATYEIYGNHVLNANGTFEDLSRKTLTDVTYIAYLIPYYLHFGKDRNSVGHVRPNYTSPSGARNYVALIGGNWKYDYYDSNYEVHTKDYISPKLPDGSDIDIDDLINAVEAKIIVSGITDADLVQLNPTSIADVTLRELQSAAYETVCQFGKLDRVTDLFSGVELNSSRLYPAESLYPANSLYPDGAALSSEKSMYSKLWGDEGNIQKWRYLIITYKGLDEEQKEKDFTLQRTVNADGTQDYNMSDNWLFRNLIWTAAQVGEYADAMVAKMQNMTWFPFEMWCAGLPYLETGDEIEITIGEETYNSYVLQRQLKGIQNLQDTYINGTLDIF